MRWVALLLMVTASTTFAQAHCLPTSPPGCPCSGQALCVCSISGCAVGCDAGCDLRCATADCTFQAGVDSQVHCQSTALCATTAGDDLTLFCEATADCAVDAGSESSLTCTTSTCRGQLGDRSFVRQQTGGDLDVVVGADSGVSCTGAGSCIVTAGARSTIDCGGTSQCTVTVGSNSRVTCSNTCKVSCSGPCVVFAPVCMASCPPAVPFFSTETGCGCGLLPVDGGSADDAGSSRPDGGVPLDAGSHVDAGVDGGTVDAGPRDAGAMTEADAGTVLVRADYAVGCGCTSVGPIAVALALMALLKRRR